LGTGNKYNRTNFLSKTINETSSEIKLVRVGIISFELLVKISELLDVLRNSGSMGDMKKPA
jgi:predicted solute-binding protein